MGNLKTRIPEVKAWDDGTAVMEENCVPIWHLGCAAINALEAENERLRVCGNCGNCGNLDWDDCDMDGMCRFRVTREGKEWDVEMTTPYKCCVFTPSRWTGCETVKS